MKKQEFEARYTEDRHREFYQNFFCRFPEELLPYLTVRQFSCGETIILSAERSKTVYFLMRGKAYAIDDRVQSLPYVFVELFPVEIMGDYELFSDRDRSYASIAAAESCECIAVPSHLYLRWIVEDAKALFYRLRLLMNQLGEQSAAWRQYFFMDYSARCASQILQYAAPQGEHYLMGNHQGEAGCQAGLFPAHLPPGGGIFGRNGPSDPGEGEDHRGRRAEGRT